MEPGVPLPRSGRCRSEVAPTPGLRHDGAADVLIASLCCSVGATWTIVLREPTEDGRPGRAAVWISSGVPITEPAPAGSAPELLAEHGYTLLPEERGPHGTRSARRLGLAARAGDRPRSAPAVPDPGIEPVVGATS